MASVSVLVLVLVLNSSATPGSHLASRQLSISQPHATMASANLNFITFNQDHSCLAVGKCRAPLACCGHLPPCGLAATCLIMKLTPLDTGTSKGFRIYHTDPFSKIFSSDDGNVSIIEMLFSTSLVALVLSPRHLIIQNTKVLGSSLHLHTTSLADCPHRGLP